MAEIAAFPDERARRANVLLFPREAGPGQQVVEGLVEIQVQTQRAGRRATSAHGLLRDALTDIVANAWQGPVSVESVGRLIRAEALLRVDALPALVTAHRAAHELAGIATECAACDERASGGRRAPSHGVAA